MLSVNFMYIERRCQFILSIQLFIIFVKRFRKAFVNCWYVALFTLVGFVKRAGWWPF